MVARRLDEIRSERRVSVARNSAAPQGVQPTVESRPDALLAALERAESLLTPTASVGPGRAFKQPLMFLQSLLFRVLRPYWFQQRQSQQLLIQALREVTLISARSTAAEPRQREALESVWQKVHNIEREIVAHDLPVARNFETIRADIDSLRGSVSAFQGNAAEHLKALTETLAATMETQGGIAAHVHAAGERAETAVRQSNELAARLYAAPYMNGQERFYYSDNGRRVLGFRSGRGGGDDLYVGFEDIFRGSEDFIRDRMKPYLPILTQHARVVEIGSGRGEMLDLLREAGVAATGVDTDEGMVQRCRSRGHDVQLLDGLAFLRGQPDGSLPAIFCAQVVEHLGYDDFLSFLQVSLAKLEPGGQLIFETVNPHALEAFKTFYTDLTHQRPIFPEVALAWCWLTGFDEGYVSFPTGGADLETDRRMRGEYAVVATKRRPANDVSA